MGSKGASALKAKQEAGLFCARRPQQHCHLLTYLSSKHFLSPEPLRGSSSAIRASTVAKPARVREEALSGTISDIKFQCQIKQDIGHKSASTVTEILDKTV